MEDNFILNIPTKVYFGDGEEEKIGNILKDYNATKILIVYGRNSVVKSGLLDKIINLINASGIEYVLLGGVRANPTIDFVRDGIKLFKDKNCDFALAIGGGSVIDTTKLIALGSKYDGDPFDFSKHITKPIDRYDFGVVLTIAAAGSEMSNSCVVQDDRTMEKLGFVSDLNRPAFAIVNPKLTESVIQEQLANGICDAITHSLERFLCPSSKYEVADDFALAIIKSIIKAGGDLYKDPTNKEARASFTLLASLSHNGISSVGKKYTMVVHQLEHVLSGIYPSLAHGRGLAMLYPAYMNEYLMEEVDKYDAFARKVFDLTNDNKLENAKMGISALKDFFINLDLPTTLHDVGIKADANVLAKKFSKGGTRVIDHPKKPLNEHIALAIYSSII